jgi:hypothetical protein
MTTVPPPNVALPQVPAAATAPTTIVIAQPPAALAAVPVGTTIEAMVLPPPPAPVAPTGAPAPPPVPVVVLHTALGDLTVRLPVQLPDKAQVDIEVVRSSPQQVTVRLTSIDGMPALQYLAQNRAPAAPVTAQPVPPIPTTLPTGPQPLPPGMSWMPAGPTPFVQVGTVSAIITSAPPAIESAPSTPKQPAPPPIGGTVPPASGPTPAQVPAPTLASLPVGAGSELALKIVSVQVPGGPVLAAPAMTAPAITPPPTPPLAAPATAAPQPTPAPLAATPTANPVAPPPQPGLALAGPQGLPAPSPQPPISVQPTAPLATVTATVVTNANTAPIADIEEHRVQINARANLPVGTKIVFDVTAATLPRGGTPLPLPVPAAAPPLAGPAAMHTGWPTLSESIAVLQRSDPVAAQQLAQAIPDGGPRTAAAVISFVQAMRSGDARQWPGDTNLRALERAGPRGAQLAAALSGEVAELASRTRESGAEWRAMPVPWNAQGQIDRIALITRREGEGESEGRGGKKGGGTRFLIDLNLSRLGAMQFDGMFRTEARSFDMVLRTKEALPEEMRRDLLGIFGAANGAMGLKGGLTFQVTKKFAAPLPAGKSPDKAGFWA